MTALLALASALIIGSSDFGGGWATRRDDPFRVTGGAQLAGMVAAVVLAVVVDAPDVGRTDVIAGAVAGASGAFSFICFYRALASGAMSVIAPTTALVGAAVPSAVGITRGEELSATTAAGLAVAIVAIFLVTRETTGLTERATPPAAFAFAVVAGLGFSVFFLALAETETEAGMWPLVVARVASVPVVVVLAWRLTGRAVPADRPALGVAIVVGITEMVANALILVALRRGPIAVASVFGSLYPVSTVVLAWLVLRERIGRLQLIGLGLTLGALALVAV